MKARRFIESALVITVMTVALGAVGAATASAQELPPCDVEGPPCLPCPEVGPCVIPPTCVEFTDAAPPSCTSEIALFTPENDSWTYVFDANNSIKISTPVSAPFFLKVDRRPITDAEYLARVTGTPFVNSKCHPTLVPSVECNFYRVHGEFVPRGSFGAVVEYIVGFLQPGIQGNKHDWMLLRDPHSRYFGDPETPFLDDRFCQEITTKVNRHYIVPGSSVPDPGVGGVALGMSDYIVAYQRLRPASKRSVDPTCPIDPVQ